MVQIVVIVACMSMKVVILERLHILETFGIPGSIRIDDGAILVLSIF
jgi:hypothetical protein